MRAILAAAILLLCLSSAETEPEYSAMLPGSFHLGGGDAFASLVEIESSRARGNRKTVAAPHPAAADKPAAAAPQPQPTPAANADSTSASPAASSANSDATVGGPAAAGAPAADAAPQVSLDDVCGALLTSAQDNGLPVAFFANLIWQESRLRDDAVSPKGALGIAQFMPQVAAESGLDNPFDPLQALSASARLLHALRDQFGNLGFAAAAYNAGAKRVNEWLQRGRTLPRETRGYVIDVTGQSVEQWQKAPLDIADLHLARRLPCREMPAFAEAEQEQQAKAQIERSRQAIIEQARIEHSRQISIEQARVERSRQAIEQAQRRKLALERPQPHKPAPSVKAAAEAREKAKVERERLAERRQPHRPVRRVKDRTAEREHSRFKHEANERARRTVRDRHQRA